MDVNPYDLEFFDFENCSEEEIKEINAILKGPGSNGAVELPWEPSLKEISTELLSENEGEAREDDQEDAVKSSKTAVTVSGLPLQFTASQPTLSPIARLPAPVEAFIAPPTSVGPFPNPPYVVSRTIPYLRAYPHMGMPFFACPLPGTAGEASPLPSSYGQFVPVVPASVAQENFVGHLENDPNQRNRPIDRQFNRRNKKKSSSDYHTSSFESETVVDAYQDSITGSGQASVSSPISSTVSNERPTTVPIVPLPVPPSTFGVAGGTLPLHGYPPGLHTLPYTQMSGPQPPSAAMYYVPVFNHPYNSYLPSPPSASLVLPVNLHPETETSSSISNSHEDVLTDVANVVPPASLAKTSEISPHVQSNCEQTSPTQYSEPAEGKPLTVDSIAKNVSEGEDNTDCNSSSDYPMSKSVSSSPECIPEAGVTNDCYNKCPLTDEDVKQAGQDSSRCWADLFKKPRPEVNGINRRLAAQQRHRKSNSLQKEEPYTNGKMEVPDSDVH